MYIQMDSVIKVLMQSGKVSVLRSFEACLGANPDLRRRIKKLEACGIEEHLKEDMAVALSKWTGDVDRLQMAACAAGVHKPRPVVERVKQLRLVSAFYYNKKVLYVPQFIMHVQALTF